MNTPLSALDDRCPNGRIFDGRMHRCTKPSGHFTRCEWGDEPEAFTSNEQGPLWTPTVTVERLLRQTRLSTTDQITMDRKQLEGLLFDVLRCRSEHLIPSAASETSGECPIGIKRHDICSAGTCTTCMDATRYRWLKSHIAITIIQRINPKALDLRAEALDPVIDLKMERAADSSVKSGGEP